VAGKDKLIFAADFPSLETAKPYIEPLIGRIGLVKFGKQMIYAEGLPNLMQFAKMNGVDVFLDVKDIDIPNTMAGAANALVAHGATMFNVMASAGIPSMRQSVKNKGEALVLAVTVLTSLDDENCFTALGAPARAKVLQYARDAKYVGVDGVVCPPPELPVLMGEEELRGLLKVTPGIRPKGAPQDDQRRTATAFEAAFAGADYLVIGRPLGEQAKGRQAEVAERFADEFDEGLAKRVAASR